MNRAAIRTLTVILYFILAIVFFAAFGVFIPYIFEALNHKHHSIQDLNQNIVTYYIAIFASASLDLILKLIDKESHYKKISILGLVVWCIIVFTTTAFILYSNVNGATNSLFWYLALGVLVSWGMWWLAHFKDDVFNPPINTLGGNPNKALANG